MRFLKKLQNRLEESQFKELEGGLLTHICAEKNGCFSVFALSRFLFFCCQICETETMILALVSLVIPLVLGQAPSSVGRAIFWSPISDHATTNYRTQSSNIADISKTLTEKAQAKELVVVFCSESSQLISSSDLASSIKQSTESTIFSNVYQVATEAQASICDQVLESDGMKGAQVLSPSEMLTAFDQSDVLTNGKLDSFLVKVGSETPDYKTLLSKFNSAKTLFVALQNPSSPPPAASGRYSRLLYSNYDPSYLPEGTEFSIYYENKYLYLTPEIFTGLMTGLFMFFVLLIGYRCLGSIQGAATFASVMPPLGKEG
jgi:hypothetical protein